MVSVALLMSPSLSLLNSFLIVLTSTVSHVFKDSEQFSALLHNNNVCVCVYIVCFLVDPHGNYYQN